MPLTSTPPERSLWHRVTARVRRAGAKKPLGAGWLYLYVVLAGGALFFPYVVQINTTNSVTPGLYLHVPFSDAFAHDDYASACIAPGPEADLARERGFIGESHRCPSGLTPLLKRVRGVAGDTMTVSEAGVFRNGERLGDAPPTHDRDGRPMPVRYGTVVVPDGYVWLGSIIPNGYDSRYLGAFGPDQVLGRSVLALRF